MDEAVEYFMSLFRNDTVTDKHVGFDWNVFEDNISELAEEIFQDEAVSRIIKLAPARKAPGPSGITNDMIRACGSAAVRCFVNWFRFCFMTGTIPIGWQ